MPRFFYIVQNTRDGMAGSYTLSQDTTYTNVCFPTMGHYLQGILGVGSQNSADLYVVDRQNIEGGPYYIYLQYNSGQLTWYPPFGGNAEAQMNVDNQSYSYTGLGQVIPI